MTGAAPTRSPHAINFSWLVRLRWGAVVGQLATIWVVRTVLGVELPLPALLAVVGVEVATNVAALLWLRAGRPIGEAGMALTMALDIVLLTALLLFSGGPFNPFSFLYLVHIALAAVVLRPLLTWSLVALSLACSGGLFYQPLWRRLAPANTTAHAEHMEMHLQGMWIAFAVAAAFIVYFVTRIRRALAEREADLAAQRGAALRNERLASLATLAAGAAHELSTPLGTIAVTARELEREAERQRPARMDDVRLIRAEIDRCRNILDQMGARAGETAGEAPVPTTLGALVDEALRQLPAGAPVEVALGALRAAPLVAPPRALGQALRGLVKNALDASESRAPVRITAAPVRITAAPGPGELRLTVSDQGPGMADEVLARAGEPFFTTKAPGRGLGLGLFLARTLVEQIGGRLTLESTAGQGTRVTVALAAAGEAAASAQVRAASLAATGGRG